VSRRTAERAEARARRRADHWAARRAAATTPAEQARLAWDLIRAQVAALPEPQRTAAWARVAAALQAVTARDVRSGANFAVPTPVSPRGADPAGRSRVREAAPPTAATHRSH
jgi:hypothetical protein